MQHFKKHHPLFYLRASVAWIVGILCLGGILGLFYPLPFFDTQIGALLQRLLVDFSISALVLSGAILLMTLLLGRVYCSSLCPLGLFQEFLLLFSRRKMKASKHHAYKYFIAALVFGALIGGTALLLRWLDPYSIFGSAFSGASFGLAWIIIIAILVWSKGRYFCAEICPIGTLLGLISKHSYQQIHIQEEQCISCGLCASVCPTGSIDFKNHSVDNETCIKCFRCLSQCHQSALHYGHKQAQKVPFSPTRRQLLIGGGILAVFALAAKSGIDLSKQLIGKIKDKILPPGAQNPDDFANRCLNCNLCVENCPMKIIKKANADCPTVHLEYGDSFCDYDCHKCSEVCPSGAIKRLSLSEKQNTQIGLAHIDESLCVKCGLCVMKCPRQITTKADGAYPKISSADCIGCGACQSACPVQAISITALNQQKLI